MTYEPYLNKGLITFEDVIDAFNKFEDGGYWVKKIIKGGGFLREIVEGPFNIKDANKNAKEWKKIFKYGNDIKKNEIAKVYNFFSLVCYHENIKKDYLKIEHIWEPPSGTELFCMLKKPDWIVVKEKYETENKNFKKFYNYVKNFEIIMDSYFDYNIYINSKNYKSIIRYRVAKTLIDDYAFQPLELEEYLKYLMGKNIEKKFISLPLYLKEFNNSCYAIYLNLFKTIKNINNFYSKLKNCLPEENIHINNKLNFYVLIDEKDYKAKKIIFDNKEKFIFEDNIILNTLDENLYIEGNINENYLAFILYIAKGLNINNIKYKSYEINYVFEKVGFKIKKDNDDMKEDNDEKKDNDDMKEYNNEKKDNYVMKEDNDDMKKDNYVMKEDNNEKKDNYVMKEDNDEKKDNYVMKEDNDDMKEYNYVMKEDNDEKKDNYVMKEDNDDMKEYNNKINYEINLKNISFKKLFEFIKSV